jgi:hypothetical protein
MSLKENAVLVRLSVTLFTRTVVDHDVTEEVRRRKSAGERVGRYLKHIFAPGSTDRLMKLVTAARADFHARTFPWDRTGAALLPLKGWNAFDAAFRLYESGFNEALDEFIQAYDRHIESAKAGLGDMFRPEDYPPREDVRSACSFSVEYLPIPDVRDFRVGDDGVLAERIATSVGRAYGEYVERLCDELYREVLSIHEQLDKGERFRIERIDRLKATVAKVAEFNLTDDPLVNSALSITSAQVLARLESFWDYRAKARRSDKDEVNAELLAARDACRDAAEALIGLFA